MRSRPPSGPAVTVVVPVVSAFTSTGSPEVCACPAAAATAAASAALSTVPVPAPMVARFPGWAGVFGNGADGPSARSGSAAGDDALAWPAGAAAAGGILSAATAVTAAAGNSNLMERCIAHSPATVMEKVSGSRSHPASRILNECGRNLGVHHGAGGMPGYKVSSTFVQGRRRRLELRVRRLGSAEIRTTEADEMRRGLRALMVLGVVAGTLIAMTGGAGATTQQPVDTRSMPDPGVYLYDGTFYAFTTGGFGLWESTAPTASGPWTAPVDVLDWSSIPGWADQSEGIWAPDVIRLPSGEWVVCFARAWPSS